MTTTTDTTTTTTTTTTAPPVQPQIIRPEVRATLVPGTATEVRVRAGAHELTIDEPAALGGTDLGANPVEHLLAALGSCQVITFKVWAAKLGIALDGVDVAVTGTIDLAGFFGLSERTRPGYQAIEVTVTLTGPESPERYTELSDAVERHCPVLDSLGGVPVGTTYAYA